MYTPTHAGEEHINCVSCGGECKRTNSRIFTCNTCSRPVCNPVVLPDCAIALPEREGGENGKAICSRCSGLPASHGIALQGSNNLDVACEGPAPPGKRVRLNAIASPDLIPKHDTNLIDGGVRRMHTNSSDASDEDLGSIHSLDGPPTMDDNGSIRSLDGSANLEDSDAVSSCESIHSIDGSAHSEGSNAMSSCGSIHSIDGSARSEDIDDLVPPAPHSPSFILVIISLTTNLLREPPTHPCYPQDGVGEIEKALEQSDEKCTKGCLRLVVCGVESEMLVKRQFVAIASRFHALKDVEKQARVRDDCMTHGGKHATRVLLGHVVCFECYCKIAYFGRTERWLHEQVAAAALGLNAFGKPPLPPQLPCAIPHAHAYINTHLHYVVTRDFRREDLPMTFKRPNNILCVGYCVLWCAQTGASTPSPLTAMRKRGVLNCLCRTGWSVQVGAL